MKRQIDGELDDTRLTEGLTGELTVYKRRGMERPELGRPQLKYASVNYNHSSCLYSNQTEENQIYI